MSKYQEIVAAYRQELEKRPVVTQEQANACVSVVKKVAASFFDYIGLAKAVAFADRGYDCSIPGYISIGGGMRFNPTEGVVSFALSVPLASHERFSPSVVLPLKATHDNDGGIVVWLRDDSEKSSVSLGDDAALRLFYDKAVKLLIEDAIEQARLQ